MPMIKVHQRPTLINYNYHKFLMTITVMRNRFRIFHFPQFSYFVVLFLAYEQTAKGSYKPFFFSLFKHETCFCFRFYFFFFFEKIFIKCLIKTKQLFNVSSNLSLFGKFFLFLGT